MPSATTPLIDRIVAYLAPHRAIERAIARAGLEAMTGPRPLANSYGSSYAGANDQRYRNAESWNRSLPGMEDAALGAHYRETLRLEVRDLYRNSEICRALVDRLPSYIVWQGIWPLPTTSDKGWNDAAARWWETSFVPSCDVRNRPGVDLITHQKLFVKGQLNDGETAYIKLASGQFQPVEAERIRTPGDLSRKDNVIDGAELNAAGQIVAWYICDRTARGSVDVQKYTRVPAEDMIYCGEPNRFDQIRGITRLAPCVSKIRDYDETDLYVLNKVKADGQNLYNKSQTAGSHDIPRRGYTKTDTGSTNAQKVIKTEFGQIWNGDRLEPIEGKTPSSEYVRYLTHELTTISACVGIPFEYLMLVFTQGSFSSQIAANLHANHAFAEWNDGIVRMFLQPLWNWRIPLAIRRGELPPPQTPVAANGIPQPEWMNVDWSMPHMWYLDPHKQTTTDKELYRMGVTSLTRMNNARNQSRDQVLDEKADDIRQAVNRAKRLAKDTGENVTWRDLVDSGVGQRLPDPTPVRDPFDPAKEDDPEEADETPEGQPS